jgi:hypothetical protein
LGFEAMGGIELKINQEILRDNEKLRDNMR